jgi:iron complex outermembrane receptor protein
MLKKAILSILSLTTGIGFFYAQNGIIKGTLTDATTSESLIQASITYAPGKGVVTDFDGNYKLEIPYGEYTITYSYIGFKSVSKIVTVSKKPTVINLALQEAIMREVNIIADIAKERETPVAFTNISPARLDEELASQDLPMVLNSTPSVYATQSGGGDGDARITIRGFSQVNLAVMIDGVPVNDMETGAVYWSNWFGLDVVTKTIQVQRGLGVSKLAVPSVGGTMNILTQGIGAKPQTKLKLEAGSNAFLRSTVSVNSGKLKGDWGFSGALSRKTGNGWADQTYTDGWFYYGKVEKKIKNHLLSFSLFGAPQSHGQRPYKNPISYFDSSYAKELGVNSQQIARQSLANKGSNFGFRFNDQWGEYTNRDGNEITFLSNENYFHKQQYTLKDFWQVNDKFYVSNVAYMSIASGGGTGTRSMSTGNEGLLDMQFIYDNNGYIDLFGTTAPNIDPQFHPTERKGTAHKYSSINNHSWFGLLSTGTYNKNEHLSISGGFDFRSYTGGHYREVYDLIGADYIVDDADQNSDKRDVRVGDRMYYNDKGLVNWGGVFGQTEYKDERWSAFVSASTSMSAYKAIDYYKKKTIDVGDTTLAIGFNDEVTYNGVTYNKDSEGLKTYETDWKKILGFTVKGGANYILSETSNIYTNLGYLSNAPKFKYVYNQSNELINDIENEKIKAIELGYGYIKNKFAGKINTYYTNWVDRPYTISVRDEDNQSYFANIMMNALHMGIEFEAAYNLTSKITVEAVVALGEWTWQSSSDSITFQDQSGKTIADGDGNIQYVSFDAKGVHVGDAAQTQLGASLRYDITKRLYLKGRYTWFDRYYANFEPRVLDGENKGRESWRIPSYGLMDVHAGYGFKLDKSYIDIRVSVLNALNTRYIADAQNNDQFSGQTYNDFDAKSASVFFGLGRRVNFSVQIKF